MRDLIVKLETLKESKEWQKYIWGLRAEMEEKNAQILAGELEDGILLSEADMIRHEINFINWLIDWIKIKDKEVKSALIEDLEKSKNWRIDRLLGRTHEYKLENILEWDSYASEDLIRSDNRWIECMDNLPNKLLEKLKLEETQVEERAEAEIDEQINALSSLELNGL